MTKNTGVDHHTLVYNCITQPTFASEKKWRAHVTSANQTGRLGEV